MEYVIVLFFMVFTSIVKECAVPAAIAVAVIVGIVALAGGSALVALLWCLGISLGLAALTSLYIVFFG